MGDRVLTAVGLSGLASAWQANVFITELLDDEMLTGLVCPPEGEVAPITVQLTAVVSKPFVVPILMKMREAKSLHLPSVYAREEVFKLCGRSMLSTS